MNQQDGNNLPAFFITEAAPCPYLEGEMERKLFTHLVGDNADLIHHSLSKAGFRRSQTIAYRPACDRCQACQSSRVLANKFTPSASFRRILRRNSDLTRHVLVPSASREQYELLRLYLDDRHKDGGMTDMTSLDYIEMVEETAVDTHLVEYRSADGSLVACLLADNLADGLSMVYSFFNPAFSQRSLGSFMILDQIARAKSAGLPHVYLGYLTDKSQKMAYKKRFQPLQCLGKNGWVLYNF
ncbi:arginyltransferase [Alphaproteobacteria bacterium]|nr:arginyltransferase [Alphaproteobacteria bacterium]